MSSYQDLLAQKAALEKQAAELEKALSAQRTKDRTEVITKIKSLMAEQGLSLADLGFARPAKKAGAINVHAKVAPKYRNKDTGETWSGRGLQPRWVVAALAAGKTLSEFSV